MNGVKVYHLVAQPFTPRVRRPASRAECWGYNGTTPGPLIEAVEGDRVRIYVTNRLPEATAVHWHGLFVPNGMDGVAGLTQPGIPPGETFRYEFTLRQSGTLHVSLRTSTRWCRWGSARSACSWCIHARRSRRRSIATSRSC